MTFCTAYFALESDLPTQDDFGIIPPHWQFARPRSQLAKVESAIERGRRNPTITIVERLATALGVDVVESLRPT